MELDDKLCLCFHVTKRKVVNFLKVNRVRRASQLSECYGAGTGCGWCRPFLVRLFEASENQQADDLPTALLEASKAVGRDDIICVIGSYYLAGEAKQWLADRRAAKEAAATPS